MWTKSPQYYATEVLLFHAETLVTLGCTKEYPAKLSNHSCICLVVHLVYPKLFQPHNMFTSYNQLVSWDRPRWGPREPGPLSPIFYFYFYFFSYYIFYFVVGPLQKPQVFLFNQPSQYHSYNNYSTKNLTKTIKTFTIVIVFQKKKKNYFTIK